MEYTNRDLALQFASMSLRDALEILKIEPKKEKVKREKYKTDKPFILKKLRSGYELIHTRTGLKSRFDKYGFKRTVKHDSRRHIDNPKGIHWIKRLDVNIVQNLVFMDGIQAEIDENAAIIG